MTATYNLMIITSLMLAFWVNYGVSKWSLPGVEYDNAQWRTSMGIQLAPGVMLCLMIVFVPETPRWLIDHGRSEEGLNRTLQIYREIEVQGQ